MQAAGTRIEPKAQAISWLRSQLRWEAKLDDLRESRDSHREIREDTPRKAA